MHISLSKLVHGFFDTCLRHGELLNNRCDVVSSRELQHLTVETARRYKATLNSDALEYERHVRDLEVVRRDGKRVDDAASSHERQNLLPVGLRRRCHQQAIDGVSDGKSLGALGSDEFVSAELESLGFLCVGAGENDDPAAHSRCELDSQMAQAADAHDADRVTRLHSIESSEGRGSTALLYLQSAKSTSRAGEMVTYQWCSSLIADLLRDQMQESLTPDDVGSETTLIRIGAAIQLALIAEGLAALEALKAVSAAVGLVAPAHAVTLLEVLDCVPHDFDHADAFVAQHHVCAFLQYVRSAIRVEENTSCCNAVGLVEGSLNVRNEDLDKRDR